MLIYYWLKEISPFKDRIFKLFLTMILILFYCIKIILENVSYMNLRIDKKISKALKKYKFRSIRI